jgi:hypothetical protein
VRAAGERCAAAGSAARKMVQAGGRQDAYGGGSRAKHPRPSQPACQIVHARQVPARHPPSHRATFAAGTQNGFNGASCSSCRRRHEAAETRQITPGMFTCCQQRADEAAARFAVPHVARFSPPYAVLACVIEGAPAGRAGKPAPAAACREVIPFRRLMIVTHKEREAPPFRSPLRRCLHAETFFSALMPQKRDTTEQRAANCRCRQARVATAGIWKERR